MSKFLRGKVLNVLRDKTIAVAIERKFQHPKGGKLINRIKRVHVHDQYNVCKPGDEVSIKYTRPISKTKHHILATIIKHTQSSSLNNQKQDIHQPNSEL